MPYMLAPGARLYIGPHGQPEESLGACCASCASGGPCATGLGATKTATLAALTAGNAGVNMAAQATAASTSHKMLAVGVLAGVAALGALYLARHKRR